LFSSFVNEKIKNQIATERQVKGEPLHMLSQAAQPEPEPDEYARTPRIPLRGRARAADIKDMLTAKEVGERLGISYATVQNRIRDRYLRPVKYKGRLYFSPHEVDEERHRVTELQAEHARLIGAPRTPQPKDSPANKPKEDVTKETRGTRPRTDPNVYTGEQAAQSVQIFRSGKGQLDVVTEMKVTYETARHLWECFQAAQPAWTLPPKDFAQIRLLISWDEEIPTPEGMRKALAAHIAGQVEREVKAALEKQLGGEELTPEEKAALAEADEEDAKRQATREAAVNGKKEGKP